MILSYIFIVLGIAFLLSFVVGISLISTQQSNNDEDELSNISPEFFDLLNEQLKNEKIRNYVEQMSLNELYQLLPEDVFRNTPKKRKDLEEAVIKEIQDGKIKFKNNNNSYYVDSDNILENNKEYYYEDIKERQDESTKQFNSIVKDNAGITKSMILPYNNDSLIDIDSQIRNIYEKKSKCKRADEKNPNLEDKIKYALTLEPNKQNYITFKTLLDEYNNLDFDSKMKISRKYTSELESLKNKAERA